MLLLIEDWDGNEELFDVAPNVKLRSCLSDVGQWVFQLTDGRQIARNTEGVAKITLGDIDFAADEAEERET